MNLEGIKCVGLYWTDLPQDLVQQKTQVNTIMNIRAPKKRFLELLSNYQLLVKDSASRSLSFMYVFVYVGEEPG
jgi:hypothetical protein